MSASRDGRSLLSGIVKRSEERIHNLQTKVQDFGAINNTADLLLMYFDKKTSKLSVEKL